MPTSMTLSYHFGGDYTQDIYTEQEMASALGVTTDALRSALDDEMYGPCADTSLRILCYHAHPLSSGQFLFNRSAYQLNLKKNNLRLWAKQSGYWTNDEACRTFLAGTREEDLEIWDEAEFTKRLADFVAAWVAEDTSYHPSIKGWVERRATLRRIWKSSGYFTGLRLGITDKKVIFYGPNKPAGGTEILWEYLRYHPDYGFYDQRDLPTVKQQFLPTLDPAKWVAYSFVEQHFYPVLGAIVHGAQWIYDDIREFVGIVTATYNANTVEITINGRWVMKVDVNSINAIYNTWTPAAE